MTLHFESESQTSFSFDCEALGKEIFSAFLDYVNCPYEAEVSLLLTTDEEIQKVNRETRNMDKSTDVLSFPMNEFPIAGDFSFLESEPYAFHPESGELILGDILISTEHIKNQAAEYGHSERREFSFLMVHSLFHLIGYDHIAPEDAVIMEEKQKSFLHALGIERT